VIFSTFVKCLKNCETTDIDDKSIKKHLTYKYYTLIRVIPINDWFNKGWKNHYPVDSAILPIQPAPAPLALKFVRLSHRFEYLLLVFCFEENAETAKSFFSKTGGWKLWWAHNRALLSRNYHEFRDLKSWQWHYFASKSTMFLASLCWLNKE
jgi:hypothetical protein